MVNSLKVIVEDASGKDVYFIKTKEIESCIIVRGNKYLLNMKSGNQIQIHKQFSTLQYNTKKIEWDKLPDIICYE